MILDAHHHLWRRSRGDYHWLTEDMPALWRDFEPDDLAPLMAACGVAGGIVVQAAESEAETRFLLALAETNPAILGVVGWTDFGAPAADEAVARLSTEKRLKGLRPMLQDMADDDFILSPEADRALGAVAAAGLAFEALIRPRRLRRLLRVRERHPTLDIVVDHAAKPDIAAGAWEPWASDLAAVAADGLTHCKLSGLITEAGPDWTLERLRPYVDHVIDVFGPDRVMWGSDWPVSLTAGTYGDWLTAARSLLADLSDADQARVFGEVARRFYRLA